MEASRTAVLVCQGRAVAHGRGLDDPTALPLLRAAERGPVELVRAGTPPNGWTERMTYESVRATGEVMVPRTLAIDAAVRERDAPQLVILGAGLDGRAWRLPAPAVFEVDHPASQQDKRDRCAGLPAVQRWVPVDFARDDLAAALAAAGHDPAVPTTWVWEGVVPYLRRGEVIGTVHRVDELSAPGSRLIVNYQARAFTASVGRLVLRTLTGPSSPLAHEPNRSVWTPAAMAALLAGHGFRVRRDQDLLTLAGPAPTQRASLRNGRVLVADRV